MEEKRFAILIDGDNISCDYIKIILDEISTKGIATYKRVYGDWTIPNLSGWKKASLEYSVTPVQQYSYTSGKNSTDCAMIIDAMDILYSDRVDGFCLATSDSDFTRLASRLRESGMTVIGMGEEKTPRPFVSACDEFKFVDKLAKDAESKNAVETAAVNVKSAAKPTSKQSGTAKVKTKNAAQTKIEDETSQTDKETLRLAIESLIKDKADEEGNMSVSDVGNILSKRYPDFDVRNYGCKRMSQFLESFGCFSVTKVKDPDNKKCPGAMLAYVKIKKS